MRSIFLPFQHIGKQSKLCLLLGTICFLLFVWVLSPSPLMPSPLEVFHSFGSLWGDGLGVQLYLSYILNLQAIAVSLVVSLGLAYLSLLPVFNFLVRMTTGLRFLSMVGLSLMFQVAFRSPHIVKVAMLSFSISVWFVTAMLDVIASVPQEQIDLARTLRFPHWKIVWEVIILGTADRVFDVMRGTVAIGWMSLTFIESLVFAEGGVGTVLQTMQKHMRLSEIMAIQISILCLGIAQDYGIGALKNFFCPYARSR